MEDEEAVDGMFVQGTDPLLNWYVQQGFFIAHMDFIRVISVILFIIQLLCYNYCVLVYSCVLLMGPIMDTEKSTNVVFFGQTYIYY